jgi:hypothetical protein
MNLVSIGISKKDHALNELYCGTILVDKYHSKLNNILYVRIYHI